MFQMHSRQDYDCLNIMFGVKPGDFLPAAAAAAVTAAAGKSRPNPEKKLMSISRPA
jgi:hypothetical protein